ncbi:MAG: sigma-70 family RNA polymerase sigma factor [Phycisphaerae bacterium]|nr:sigma-70 family RNA polymerase sigma factor [Phycisphaerae bacterium]
MYKRQRLLELLEESGASLHVLFVRLTLREDVAEELMQELFIKLSRSRRFERVENCRYYARKAAINLAFDWRRRQRHLTVPLEAVTERVGSEENPADDLIRREELEEVLNAVERLGRPGRDVVVMRYIEQRSYDDIAQRFGMTAHHIRAVCHRARERLKTLLSRSSAAQSERGFDDV